MANSEPSSSCVVARFIAAILFACGCCLATQSIADGQFHKRARHSHRSAPAGWGWDSSSGWYAGPFFGRGGHGYFRCFDPGYGWHSCPHYFPGSLAAKPPRRWWRWHFILPGPTFGENYRGGVRPIRGINEPKISAGSKPDLSTTLAPTTPTIAPPLPTTTPTAPSLTTPTTPNLNSSPQPNPQTEPSPPSAQSPEVSAPAPAPGPSSQTPEVTPPSAAPGPQVPEVAPPTAAPAPSPQGPEVGPPPAAQETGPEPGPIGVTLSELPDITKGWSVKRTLLNQPVYNEKDERIGSVEDIIVTQEKTLSEAIINAGGFLALTKHNVAIPVSQFKLVDNKLVLPGATKETLRASPESPDESKAWSIKRNILGQRVYNEIDERVGSVEDIIVTPDKALSYGIINAGGFLGLTKHNVAIPVSQFKLIDNKLVLTGATKKALKASPEFQYGR